MRTLTEDNAVSAVYVIHIQSIDQSNRQYHTAGEAVIMSRVCLDRIKKLLQSVRVQIIYKNI